MEPSGTLGGVLGALWEGMALHSAPKRPPRVPKGFPFYPQGINFDLFWMFLIIGPIFYVFLEMSVWIFVALDAVARHGGGRRSAPLDPPRLRRMAS